MFIYGDIRKILQWSKIIKIDSNNKIHKGSNFKIIEKLKMDLNSDSDKTAISFYNRATAFCAGASVLFLNFHYIYPDLSWIYICNIISISAFVFFLYISYSLFAFTFFYLDKIDEIIKEIE